MGLRFRSPVRCSICWTPLTQPLASRLVKEVKRCGWDGWQLVASAAERGADASDFRYEDVNGQTRADRSYRVES